MKYWQDQPYAKQAAADDDRKAKERQQRAEAWNTLAQYIHDRDGWVTSVPHRKVLRFEVRENSELPIRLCERGFKLRYVGTDTRLVVGAFVPIQVIELRLDDLRRLLADRKITIELTPAAKELLFVEGYDRAYGARPLKRAIQRLVQDPLALKILEGEVLHGDHVVVDADVAKRQMTFTVSGREAVKPKRAPTSKTA